MHQEGERGIETENDGETERKGDRMGKRERGRERESEYFNQGSRLCSSSLPLLCLVHLLSFFLHEKMHACMHGYGDHSCSWKEERKDGQEERERGTEGELAARKERAAQKIRMHALNEDDRVKGTEGEGRIEVPPLPSPGPSSCI